MNNSYKDDYEKRMDMDEAEAMLRSYFHPQATSLSLEQSDIRNVRDAVMTILYSYYEQKEELDKIKLS